MFFPMLVSLVVHAVENFHMTAFHAVEMAAFTVTVAKTFASMAKPAPA